MRALIVGCGYVGLPLGAELARLGHQVFGLRRSISADDQLKTAGITPLHADITQPATLEKLPRDFDWVVNCVASGGGGVEDYRQLYLQGMRNLIAWLTAGHKPAPRLVYPAARAFTARMMARWWMRPVRPNPRRKPPASRVETEKGFADGQSWGKSFGDDSARGGHLWAGAWLSAETISARRSAD